MQRAADLSPVPEPGPAEGAFQPLPDPREEDRGLPHTPPLGETGQNVAPQPQLEMEGQSLVSAQSSSGDKKAESRSCGVESVAAVK